MEVSAGIVFRPVPCFSAAAAAGGDRVDTNHSTNKVSFAPPPRRNYSGFSSSSAFFSDDRHLNKYYHAQPRCGGKKEKEKEKEKLKEKGSGTKKKLKLLKGLSKDLSMFSDMGFDPYYGLVGHVQGNIVSEAADVLLRQLQQVRAEEKELKRKKKLDKAQFKATGMRTMVESESSSSYGSSDGECTEVIQMIHLRKEAFVQPMVHELQAAGTDQEESTSALSSSANATYKESCCFEDSSSMGNLKVESCSGSTSTMENLKIECNSNSNVVCDDGNSLVRGASAKRIEVCMGGKCKKSGGSELLGEFERAIGVEGAVVGCKCMGKCKDGPNVRVLNCYDGGVEAQGVVDDSVRTPTNPLCIGVGLADVGVILANFFGEDAIYM